MTQQIEELLNDVGFRLATLKEARSRFSDQLAPEFRIFDYLRTDEMGLSTCIASLLAQMVSMDRVVFSWTHF